MAFVCLNATGAVCVAYCQPFEVAPDHCPLQKKSNHCNPAENTPDGDVVRTIGGNKIDCCPMTVSFFPAPVEKRSFSFEALTLAPVAEFASLVLVERNRKTFASAYRRPPLDQRVERLKHCIIRI